MNPCPALMLGSFTQLFESYCQKKGHSVLFPKGNFTSVRKETEFGSVSVIAFQQFKLIKNRLETANSSSPQYGTLLNAATEQHI